MKFTNKDFTLIATVVIIILGLLLFISISGWDLNKKYNTELEDVITIETMTNKNKKCDCDCD